MIKLLNSPRPGFLRHILREIKSLFEQKSPTLCSNPFHKVKSSQTSLSKVSVSNPQVRLHAPLPISGPSHMPQVQEKTINVAPCSTMQHHAARSFCSACPELLALITALHKIKSGCISSPNTKLFKCSRHLKTYLANLWCSEPQWRIEVPGLQATVTS